MTQPLVLNLIAAPGSHALDEPALARLTGVTDTRGARWLAPNEACEIPLAPMVQAQALRAGVRNALAGLPIDVIVRQRRTSSDVKRLLIADMESTIIEQEMLDELADTIGMRAHVSAITERAMRGELDFEAALKERVRLLSGLDASVLTQVYDKTVTLMPGAATLVATMKARGSFCALVSGGFTVFTERVSHRLGFDTHRANTLEIRDGKLTGEVVAPILGHEAKLATLQDLARTHGIKLEQSLAVGDGANDLAMLKAAGLGVAFHAKPKVSAEVDEVPGGAVIGHGDLTALLYLQGLGCEDFAP